MMSRFAKLTIFVFILVLVSGFAAYKLDLDETVVVSAEVVPRAKIHRFSASKEGVVKEIFIKVGSELKKGSPIAQLDTGESELRLQLARIEIQALKFKLEKLQLALEILRADRPSQADYDLQDQSANAIIATQQSYKDLVRVEQSNIDQQARAKSNILQAIQNRKKLVDVELARTNELTKKGVRPEATITPILKERALVIQQIEELKFSIELLETKKRELEAQLKFKRASSIETLSLNISNLEEQVASKDHEIKTLELWTDSSLLISPIDGLVTAVSVSGKGEFLSRGVVICEILPEGSEFDLVAKVPASEVVKVFENQRAKISFSGVDPLRSAYFDGTVTKIAQNTTVGYGGAKWFDVWLEFDNRSTKTEQQNQMLEVLSGMTAEVRLIQEEQSIVDLILGIWGPVY